MVSSAADQMECNVLAFGGPGYLPTWLILTALISLTSSIIAFVSPDFVHKLYSGPDTPSTSHATPLSARTFGAWTLFMAFVRMTAAVKIFNVAVYDVAALSYAIELAHLVSEGLLFRSARRGARFSCLVLLAGVSLTWMITRRPYHAFYWEEWRTACAL